MGNDFERVEIMIIEFEGNGYDILFTYYTGYPTIDSIYYFMNDPIFEKPLAYALVTRMVINRSYKILVDLTK